MAIPEAAARDPGHRHIPPTSSTSLQLTAAKFMFPDSLAMIDSEISTPLCASTPSALSIARMAYPTETNVRALTHKIDLLPADIALLCGSLQKPRE